MLKESIQLRSLRIGFSLHQSIPIEEASTQYLSFWIVAHDFIHNKPSREHVEGKIVVLDDKVQIFVKRQNPSMKVKFAIFDVEASEIIVDEDD